MKIGYIIAFLIAGVSLYLFAEARSARPAAPAAEAVTTVTSTGTAVTAACPAPEDMLRIEHPCEGARLPFLSSTFVFGSADPRGKLAINGQPVPIHPGGGFIAMVRLSTGTCVINAELLLDSAAFTAARTIFVTPPAALSPVSPLTIEYVQPDIDYEVLPGEEIPVACKGSPGVEASFTVDGVKGKFHMIETSPGMYRGTFAAGAHDRLKESKIQVTLADTPNREKASMESERTLSFFKSDVPVMAEVSGERAVLRSGPGAAYMLFLPRSTQLQITGRRGSDLRVRLAGTREAWIAQNDVRLLPEGTPPARVVAGNIAVTGNERTTLVRLSLGKRIPFEVVPDDDGKFIDVLLFGAVSGTDMIVYPSTSSTVEQVRWFQDGSDTYRLRVRPFPGRWWGYDARYEGSSFVLELRSPPAMLRGKAPLSGITVAVDPGHSPDTGAIGPTGLREKEANLALARCLKDTLVAQGAKVVMTRSGDEPVPLYDRPKIAFQANADILVSVHNNALPDGKNPFEKNGYGVYFYHPMSLPLARAIHTAYGELLGPGNRSKMELRDDGLYYNNLAIPRTTQMPTVLTESAYIIIPQEEAYLKSSAFQQRCAYAITRGIKRYVNAVCKRESPPPKTKKSTKK